MKACVTNKLHRKGHDHRASEAYWEEQWNAMEKQQKDIFRHKLRLHTCKNTLCILYITRKIAVVVLGKPEKFSENSCLEIYRHNNFLSKLI